MDATWIMLAVVAALALAVGFLLHKASSDRRIGGAEREARRIVEAAEREADTRRKSSELETREGALKARATFEEETRRRERDIQAIEQRVIAKEEDLARKLEQLERRLDEFTGKDRSLGARERAVTESERRLASALEEQRHKLESIAGLTAEEAKRQLLAQMEGESRREAQLTGMRLEEEARETAREKAKEVLATTIQRLAPDYTVETSVSVVDLPSDDMKGRIIGREGRNIRALELHTGVDLIVDDTPEAVILSGFDPIRREIARISLERLMQDGRIHPARIEELVEKVRQELDQKLFEEGEAAAFSLGITDIHPEVLRLLGRLRYRTSYGQNVLMHSLEVAQLAALMAIELGVNDTIAKRGGLLHDIGKAIDREMEGTHLELGRQVLEKYAEKREIIHAMECHHGDYDPTTVEAVLVNAADALSAARPGARREILENYVHRLERLESIANSMDGVAKSFAIQAGRELRIIVNAEKITDEQSIWLSKDVARKIEAELQYPGQIKVTVIREMRAVDYAK